MIEVRATISSGLMEALDLLDKDVVAGLRDGVERLGAEAQDTIRKVGEEEYFWSSPDYSGLSTGNLLASVGYLTKGGGRFNLTNYSANRHIIKGRFTVKNQVSTSASKMSKKMKKEATYDDTWDKDKRTGRMKDNFPLPARPTTDGTVYIFALARYAFFQEEGTVHNEEHPFFMPGARQALDKADSIIIKAIKARGIDTTKYMRASGRGRLRDQSEAKRGY